jgi:hypothetical protein
MVLSRPPGRSRGIYFHFAWNSCLVSLMVTDRSLNRVALIPWLTELPIGAKKLMAALTFKPTDDTSSEAVLEREGGRS